MDSKKVRVVRYSAENVVVNYTEVSDTEEMQSRFMHMFAILLKKTV